MTLSEQSTDEPLTQAEREWILSLPSHEVYFLTKKQVPGVRGREVNELYRQVIDREIGAGRG